MNLRTPTRKTFAIVIMTALVMVLLIGSVSRAALASDDHDEAAHGIPVSKNQIIELTDSGVSPQRLVMKKEDSIVFFLNTSPDALASVAVDFKGKTTHCASTNLKILENGVIASTKPMQASEFASVCFHDAGTYPLTVYGLKKNPAGVQATIEVQ